MRVQVYEGRLHGLLPVAIKVIHPMHVPRHQQAFWQEAALLQRCRHPNIVQLVGVYSGRGGKELMGTDSSGRGRRDNRLPASDCGQQDEERGEAAEAGPGLESGARPQCLMVVTELMSGGSLMQSLGTPGLHWYHW